MNLFPYNTGHIMLVPNTHAADPVDLEPDALREFGERLPLFTRSMRRVFGCDGFNVGLNIGSTAGAGVAEHLHQHVVPRWLGDANFMPIIARTMAIPELIPVTYGKIRAEVERDVTGASCASMVVLDRLTGSLLTRNMALPVIPLASDLPVWNMLVGALPEGLQDVELAGWAGDASARALPADGIALALVVSTTGTLPDGWALTPIEHAELSGGWRERLRDLRNAVIPAP
jgi:diadenosine tetraphosphate (Ap4A) HIT family hydrolase